MLQLSCPHCLATNRLPEQRLRDRPNCGKCKQALFTGLPLELNQSNLSATLHNNDIPVVIDCWAAWCGPCKSFAPVFEWACQHYEPHARFAKLNTENEPHIAQHWAIRSIPTLLVFKNGKEIHRQAGALSQAQFTQWLKSLGFI